MTFNIKCFTAKDIRKLNPCEDGILQFESDYPNFKGNLIDLLQLDKTCYSNKLWLCSKVNLPDSIWQQWAVECAEMVLENFEKQFPTDSRIRDCLETVKKVICGELDKSAAESAAKSAAWSAESAAKSAAKSAARSTAWSAESAARSTAGSAKSAAESAAWSAARSTAWSAKSAAESAAWSAARSTAWSTAGAEKEQEDLNLSVLIALIDNME